MAGAGPGRLGELLVREKLITTQQLQKAQEAQKSQGGRLGAQLVRQGSINEQDLTNFLSKQYNVPSINLAEFDVDPEVIKLIPKEVSEKHQVIPVNRAGSTLIVAMADPSNIFAIDDLKFLTGYNIETVVASEAAIAAAIERYYNAGPSADDLIKEFDEDVDLVEEVDDVNVVDLEKSAGDAPVIKLVNLLLVEAIKKGASDIHVETYEKTLRVRYRIDGVLYEVMKPPFKLKSALVSRLKIMADLDIAERRLPQDGRIKLKIGKQKEMDFRVSVLPTLFGEKVVLRLLDKGNLQLDMTKLGFTERQLKDFMFAIKKPYGMCLVTGPTGSGKTTTLYSALQELNKITTNISTAEDPVEFNLYGINQVQMHEDIGLNFAAALRAFLRQDPNIIMVGEIRDFETAEIAVKAALTGHLVVSTLHTNDAPSTVNRLLNMGIEPFLVASAVNIIGAQRLARKICKDCAAPFEVPIAAYVEAGMTEEDARNVRSMKGAGCKTCANTGYKGRIALYEIMPMSDELRELVLAGASSTEIKREAIRLGMDSLRMSGLKKIMEGTSTLEEIGRVTVADS